MRRACHTNLPSFYPPDPLLLEAKLNDADDNYAKSFYR
jgi:hypothetical protein